MISYPSDLPTYLLTQMNYSNSRLTKHWSHYIYPVYLPTYLPTYLPSDWCNLFLLTNLIFPYYPSIPPPLLLNKHPLAALHCFTSTPISTQWDDYFHGPKYQQLISSIVNPLAAVSPLGIPEPHRQGDMTALLLEAIANDNQAVG